MTYILYYSRGGRQELDNVAEVYENKTQIRFVFADGLEVNVIKKYLLHYEQLKQQAFEVKESVQELFNRFDDFVDKFVCKVEETVNNQSRYSITVGEIKQFQNIINNYKNTSIVEAINMKP